MHASSLENMQKCYRRFIAGTELELRDRVVVLDVGGADVNGSYRDVFSGPQFAYLGADIGAGPGVSIALDDPYNIPLDDASVDIVLSGQMLEHCEFFWQSFAEMVRVLRPSGFLFLVAPSAGPIHRYPVDCYRFYPDAYRALAKFADCDVVDIWHDERGPWNDLVGVFRRKGAPSLRTIDRPAAIRVENGPPEKPGTAEEEAVGGQIHYLEVLKHLHGALQPETYLEIGVRRGRSLRLAACRALGVDPCPELEAKLPETARVLSSTSDDFFDDADAVAAFGAPDFVFIDGMHLFEFALRDFMNVERRSHPGTVVVVDDIFPNHPLQASRNRTTQVWTGDVWKLQDCLRRHRPDLCLMALDTSPTGLLLIAGLDRANRVLWEKYNPIVRHYRSDDMLPSPDVLGRAAALAPEEGLLQGVGDVVRAARRDNLGPRQLHRRLSALTG